MVNPINAAVAAMTTAQITAESGTHIEGLVWRYDSNGNLVSGPEQRLIDLADNMKDAVITFAREQFTRGFGMMNWQDGDRLGAITRRIIMGFSVQDRASALYTLHTIFREEALRIQDAVQQAMPNWTHGQPVPNDILSPILSGEVGFNTTV
ncbi:MAG: DUF3879 family protein [Defluviitaleaceae bacterium]|nr:DUF3879 family protein [Defluviitaleaceae bacterium]MCL2262964.1 DUF3879 family protein [Defluviitaleaceae bacterium]